MTKNRARLGVNIDHVATLRQARGMDYPNLADAARLAIESGADQITIHLREDRRHIQDADVPLVHMVTKEMGKLLNLEMGAAEEILEIAVATGPDWICLVPEKRDERTTEGGLNLKDKTQYKRIKYCCEVLRKKTPRTKISLFVEADKETLELCGKLEVDAVEIHTGEYAIDALAGKDIKRHLKQYKEGHAVAQKAHMGYHAGHGLTDQCLRELVELDVFSEYNIGHWIICDSVYSGMKNSIKKLLDIVNE